MGLFYSFLHKHDAFSFGYRFTIVILYDKGILIRGAIGATNDYYIDEEGNERFFIIDNIAKAATVEKNQDSANVIVFGKELFTCFQSSLNYGLTDDYFSRLDYFHTNSPKRMFIKNNPDCNHLQF